MKQHEREYFVSQLRSGIFHLVEDDITLTIVNPTVEQYCESCRVFSQAYSEAYRSGIMTKDDMLLWMTKQGMWSQGKEDQIEGLKKDIERLKVEIFNARNKTDLVNRIRQYIRAGEKQLFDIMSEQLENYPNTLEGVATASQTSWLIEHCTFLDGEAYDFSDFSVSYVTASYRESILSPEDVRELARNEPWRSLWLTKNDSGCNLFINVKDRELNDNQKSILVWSQMYDNIQESMDCPSESVIDDDDMLDGWFIIQRQKREKEKAESEFEDSTKSDKIKQSHEVYMMAGSNQDAARVSNMNDIGGKITIKQREATMKKKGGRSVSQGEFMDEKIRLQNQQNQQYKSKFGG